MIDQKKSKKNGRTLSLKKQFSLVQVEIALDCLNAWLKQVSSNLKQPQVNSCFADWHSPDSNLLASIIVLCFNLHLQMTQNEI